MAFETWIAFTVAATVLLVIPGPTILLVVSYALGQGWRTALPMAVGVALGDFTAMTLSMLGVGALLLASATIFAALKWAGAAYLVYLGVKLFRAGGTLNAEPRTGSPSAVKMATHAWLVTALNPKSLTFFVAFLPQFLDHNADFLSQMLVLESTFLVLAFTNAFGVALAASRARTVVGNPRTIRLFNRAGGTLLVGAGIANGSDPYGELKRVTSLPSGRHCPRPRAASRHRGWSSSRRSRAG